MNPRKAHGGTYKIRFDMKRLPVPDHNMTRAEKDDLVALEEAFTKRAHALGVHVTLSLIFPADLPETP